MIDWYTDLGVTFSFINHIINACNNSKFPIDRSNNRRAAFDTDFTMRTYITSAISGANVWDIGIMEWPAGTGFKWHQDNHPTRGRRGSAMNIMLNPSTDNNYCEFCSINPDLESFNPDLHKREIVPYRQNVITIINTKEWHRVVNNSPISRYVLTIGFDGEDKDYLTLKNKFLNGQLFDRRYLTIIPA